MQNIKNNLFIYILIAVISIVVGVMVVTIVLNSDKVYKLSDYLVINEYDIERNCADCIGSGVIKRVSFRNIDDSIVRDFIKSENSFINLSLYDNNVKLSNEVSYFLDKNILSVYVLGTSNYSNMSTCLYPECSYIDYGVNINLDTMESIGNSELLSLYNIDVKTSVKAILKQILDDVEVDEFYLDSSIQDEVVSIDEVRLNIDNYANMFTNLDSVMLYLSNNKVYVAYSEEAILKQIGLNTHMGNGLDNTMQRLILN